MKGHFVLREPRVVPCGWWAFGESCSRSIKSLTDTDKGLELTLSRSGELLTNLNLGSSVIRFVSQEVYSASSWRIAE